MAARGSLML